MSIDKIIIENFKIFEGQHVFDLNELNIFTGANNSGKSTLFQAITLFSKGLSKGDFPEVELFDLNVKNHQNLVNRNSNGNSFKIGCFIEIGFKPKPFKVLFEFTEDDTYFNPTGSIQFSNFEIHDLKNELLFGVYIVKKFKITSKNSEYENDKRRNKYGQAFPFKSPTEDSEPGILMTKINIDIFEEHISNVTTQDFSIFLKHIKSLQGKYNNWWAELFNEVHYETSDITKLTFQDLLREYTRDEYYNLAEYQTRDILYWDKENVDETWEEYIELKERIKYIDFLQEVISPILDSVKSGLNFFRRKNFAHITAGNFDEELVSKSTSSKYLFSLIPGQYDTGLADFSRKALGIFDVDGFIELKAHLNNAIEINLVTGVMETDLKLAEKANISKWEKKRLLEAKINLESDNEKIKQLKLELSLVGGQGPTRRFEENYKNNLRQNIATLGKGTASLIGIISEVFSILDEHKQEQQRHRNEPKKKKKTERVESQIEKLKLILIEEPEAFLHPDWQSKLADFLVYCLEYSKEIELKFIVETHSEYLIRKLQYLTAKKKLKPKDTIIYYFNDPNKIPKGEKQVREIRIREDGSLTDDFGPGFFDKATSLKFELLRLKNNQNN